MRDRLDGGATLGIDLLHALDVVVEIEVWSPVAAELGLENSEVEVGGHNSSFLGALIDKHDLLSCSGVNEG